MWSLLHSPFSYLSVPNTRLRFLFSNNLSLHSYLNVRDHVSQPYSTTGNTIVLYILIFKFLERSLEDKNLHINKIIILITIIIIIIIIIIIRNIRDYR